MSHTRLRLTLLDPQLAICRLDPGAKIPAWAMREPFFSITRSSDELSIVCAEQHVPAEVSCQRGWRALKLEGPFDLTSIGILSAIAAPLAEAGVSILAIGTYDTDYVLVRGRQLELAASVLSTRGHHVDT